MPNATTGSSGTPLNFSAIVAKYIDDVFTAIPGMKVLLMDDVTKRILSAVYNHSQLLNHEVVLVESLARIDPQCISMGFLSAVVFLRPSHESNKLLLDEVKAAHFKEYHVVYTNVAESELLASLGEADVHSCVKSVQEVFLDVLPVADQCCLLPLQPPSSVTLTLSSLRADSVESQWNPMFLDEWDPVQISRVVQGLAAMMLMAKRRPSIRYRSGSRVSEKIIQELAIKMRSLRFSFPDIPEKESVLVILERKDDPITPLLTQWTYEAMLHENFGICDGKVSLDSDDEEEGLSGSDDDDNNREGAGGGDTEMRTKPKSKKKKEKRPIEERVIVLSKIHDAFFSEHRGKNFGEVCSEIQKVVETYKDAAKATDMKTATLEDLKNFVREGSKVRQQSAIATRHTELLGRLDDDVRKRGLLDLSLTEQEIATQDNHQSHLADIREHLNNKRFKNDDLLRLVLLYALRYQDHPDCATKELKRTLESKRELSRSKVALVDKMLSLCGSRQRVGDCFKTNPTMSSLKSFVQAMAGFESSDDSAQSVYTQHEPWLKHIVNRIWNDALPLDQYPYQRLGASTSSGGPVMSPASSPSVEHPEMYQPANIFLFVVGGLTYEEILFAEKVNSGEITSSAPPTDRSTAQSLADRFRRSGGEGSSGGGAGEEHHGHGEKIQTRLFIASTAMLTSQSFLDTLMRSD